MSFQSTLPRGERRRKVGTGAYLIDDISIHAPARGATRTARMSLCRTDYFNPRSREGSDEHQAIEGFFSQ